MCKCAEGSLTHLFWTRPTSFYFWSGLSGLLKYEWNVDRKESKTKTMEVTVLQFKTWLSELSDMRHMEKVWYSKVGQSLPILYYMATISRPPCSVQGWLWPLVEFMVCRAPSHRLLVFKLTLTLRNWTLYCVHYFSFLCAPDILFSFLVSFMLRVSKCFLWKK